MIIHNVEQGTQEWLDLRLGIPTASEFSKLITSTGQPSKSIDALADTKAVERYTGAQVESPDANFWMQRGNELEPEAVSAYSLVCDADPQTVGFITNDDKSAGCSPDRLLGNDGLLEIKCPKPETHMGYIMKGKIDTKYVAQVQGQMWIAEREWCDWMSYVPNLPPVIVRVNRDDKFIAALEDQVRILNDKVQERLDAIQKLLS